MRELYAPEWPIRFKNVSGGNIAGYALMKCTGSAVSNNMLVLEMDQTDAADGAAHFINGPTTVSNNGYGSCRSPFDSPLWVQYDSAATPSVGEEWGPADSNWKIAQSGSGFIVLKVNATDEISLVQPLGGGGSCPEVHEITTTASPSAGDFDLDYVINSTSGTVTINYDDTAAEVKTAMVTHSQVTTSDVEVFGGPLPLVAVYVKFIGALAGTVIDLPAITDNMTGGDPRMRKAASFDWGAA